MGRKREYTDEERAERKRESKREWSRRKSIEKFGTKEEREARELERRKAVVERCSGFEYAGNYTGSEGTADIRCTKCGTITTRSWVAIRHANVRCETCSLALTEQKRAKAKQAKAEAKREQEERKAEQNETEFFTADCEQAEILICPECGKAFIPRSKRQKRCSTECGGRTNNRVKFYRRKRKIDVAMMDKTITLAKLYERDGGVCYLCGGHCDWMDFLQTDAAFIAGDDYPSIDHVQPLSKGGQHSWENVRLAHRRCNYLKRDHAPII